MILCNFYFANLVPQWFGYPLISALFFLHLVIFFPITSDLTAWYAADYVLALIVCLALAVFGFYTSLAGELLFRGALPDD